MIFIEFRFGGVFPSLLEFHSLQKGSGLPMLVIQNSVARLFSFALTFLVIVALSPLTTAFAAAFTNGSFELGANPAGPDTTISPWTFSPANGLRRYTTGDAGYDASASNGAFYVALGENSTTTFIEQIFDTVPSTTYTLTFDHRTYSFIPAAQTAAVLVTGSGTLLSDSAVSPGNSSTWSNYSNTFVANSLSTTLRVTAGTNGDNQDYFVDNFTVTAEAAVPEPSTYALGLIGLAGLGFVAWRRRK